MIAVIGDVHGCYLTLVKLVEQVKTKYPDIDIFCVGDLVDRGNFSFEVLEFVRENNITFTPGNHDYMFYYHIKEPSHPIGKPWIYNGCEPTLKSYQGRWEKMNDHLDMIKSAPPIIDHPDCFISHAGISDCYHSILGDTRPYDIHKIEELVTNEIGSDHGILWNRDDLIDIGRLQVVGHTRVFEVKQNEFNNTLYIDTAAIASNKLSAAIIENQKLVEVISEPTNKMDVIKTSF
ncbi:MAG TPA: metallophosphoesterase [Ignavibacteriaceae bacterium]|nr:metallophosphoesterase [Ignavibacteriaceae bacterium]